MGAAKTTAETKRKRRRKPKDKRREAYLRVRLTAEQDRMFRDAADNAGTTVSSWAVQRLFRAAKEELGQPGAQIAPSPQKAVDT
jgi:hypothetical protein